jgi:hypothetical protein
MPAESAAESLHRLLYYVSGAELGLLDQYESAYSLKTDSIEKKLELIFKIISRWGAILLFDEAGTFVASRGPTDNNGKKAALTASMYTDVLKRVHFLGANRNDYSTTTYAGVPVWHSLSHDQSSFGL